MANKLITREDIVRGKKNFDAFDSYLDGSASEQVTLPSGKKIKTRAGVEKEIMDKYPDNKAGLREVGTEPGNVMEVGAFGLGGRSPLIPSTTEPLLINFDKTGFFSVFGAYDDAPATVKRADFAGSMIVVRRYYDTGPSLSQILFTGSNGIFCRTLSLDNTGIDTWSLLYSNMSSIIHKTTTATSANVVVTATGELQRSTSSKIFKKDIEDISIPDYRAALKAVRPVSYRSTDATSDRTDWSWYSFIAEEIAAIDPRLAQMDSVEFFEDINEEGKPFINSRELPEGEYAANGINTNGIVALMVHINQQMLADIEALEKEKATMKSRMTKLEKRLDALEQSAQSTVK